MKILITGMNKNQCVKDFYLRQQLKVIPSHYSLIRCLEGMGHTVEQRMLEIGEDVSGYDKVIVFLAGPRQLVAVTFYRALSVIARTRPGQLILAFDDWQTKGIFDGIAACKDPEKMFAKFILGVNSVELSDVAPYAAVFQDAVDIILEKKAPVLLSCFDGGDPSLLIDYPREKLYTYNPNPYHHNRRPGDRGDVPLHCGPAVLFGMDDDEVLPTEKKKAFNFASLVQSQTKKWLKTQNIKEWPIHFYGSKADGQDRLTEGQMVKVFAEQWGCLMPGYPHAGSGWWRARPLQVADAGSILIGEPKEMMIYYQDEKLANLKAGDLEQMDVNQLMTTAALQYDAIYSNHPLNQQHQREQLQAVLDA